MSEKQGGQRDQSAGLSHAEDLIKRTAGPTNPPPDSENEASGWTIENGRVNRPSSRQVYRDEVELLTYNNPYNQPLERVWYDGKVLFAVDLGPVDIDETKVKVADEYQPVHDVELDENGKAKTKPRLIPGQLNVYDSVPGMSEYSPIWQFYNVIVPRDYKANTLRSVQDCKASGYKIVKSRDFEN